MIPQPPTSTLFPYTTLFRSAFTRKIENARCRRPSACTAHFSAWPTARLRWSTRIKCSGMEKWAVHAEGRSEEHTSELQSLTNLVCRLLLEKKKTIERECRM